VRALREADLEKSVIYFATSAFFEKKKTLTVIKHWDCQLTNGVCSFVPRRTYGPFGGEVDFKLKECF